MNIAALAGSAPPVYSPYAPMLVAHLAPSAAQRLGPTFFVRPSIMTFYSQPMLDLINRNWFTRRIYEILLGFAFFAVAKLIGQVIHWPIYKWWEVLVFALASPLICAAHRLGERVD